jgi:hypothetical protein
MPQADMANSKMFYILIVDSSGNIVSEIEEYNYDCFIVCCYNFSQDDSLEKLKVIYVRPDGKVYKMPVIAVEKMIRYWLLQKDIGR